jgi:hypothetical protein
MSIRTASRLPSTLACKLQAHYVTHEPSPAIPTPTHPPNQWLDGTYVLRNAPDRRPKNAKKPRVGGAEFGRKTIEGEHRTCGTPSTSVRLAPPLRQRCDGDHKNALFCQVLQKISACMRAGCISARCPHLCVARRRRWVQWSRATSASRWLGRRRCAEIRRRRRDRRMGAR